jgi:uncharacterized membrane protein YhaH (DUF805 family)
MYWYITVINQYFNFKGRSRRKEYWMYNLFNILFLLTAIILDNYLIGSTIEGDIPIGFLTFSYYFFVLIPTMALTVRRLHDIGKSGWYYLIALIPYIGGLILLLLMCINGEPKENKWGENPKID